jgi:hypothetical protein
VPGCLDKRSPISCCLRWPQSAGQIRCTRAFEEASVQETALQASAGPITKHQFLERPSGGSRECRRFPAALHPCIQHSGGQIRPAEWICRAAARFYGTMIDIVPKFMVAVPDWPCIVKCAAAELVLTLLPLPPPVAPPQEVSPAPSTTMSTKTASPRITAEGRLPFRR